MSRNKKPINPTPSKRPTSPHIQIYRWNLSSLTSIFHRATGIALYFSIVAIAWYIVFYSTQINISQSEKCECMMMAIMKCLFILASIAITFSLYYHFCNGIRHLFWDIGNGFDVKIATRNAVIVIFTALALTIATIGLVIYLKLF
jgi:succinate dehydrogenase / fumarate reductase cytochrome b subunit